MKKFLEAWTILTIIFGFFCIILLQNSLIERRQEWCDSINMRNKIHEIMGAGYSKEATIKNTYFEDGRGDRDLSIFSNIIIPTIFFIILFWGIPIMLGCLITIALRKPKEFS